ncbi:hypothetical protein CROQUDRAFT_92531 [Cronartium quercuum f. sp. fusiforme G11]|uniref:Uncharacterized protein n=1 Tax=Cronartium quercuum f. sp. fusiforme G11 TaxID=708437 RepID=A0A9P6TBR6_9BASI|nr:hypothetical protein CROQUDRAFT_92531 [Cronartium quercuum f. sp. fusiforme G11]
MKDSPTVSCFIITKQEDLCIKTAAQFKAANDTCMSASVKKACDDSGLFGMGYWHDIPKS